MNGKLKPAAILIVIISMLLLAACGKKSENVSSGVTEDDKRDVGTELEEGSVSFSGQPGSIVQIPDAIYTIQLESDSNYVLNVNGNYMDDGATIDIMPFVNADCQKFKITRQEDGFYHIEALSSGKLLTIEDNSKESETDLVQWADTGSDGQDWEFVYETVDRIRIRSKLGTYIDNYAGNVSEANNVWVYKASDSASQLWMLYKIGQIPPEDDQEGAYMMMDETVSFSGETGKPVDVTEGMYCINVEPDNHYVMNVNGNFMEEGTTIDIMPLDNGTYQHFIIEKTEDTYYKITAESSKLALTVKGDNADSETDLVQAEYKGMDGQKWQFIYVDQNRLKIRSKLGTYIDNYAGNLTDGNNVWMYDDNESASQIWMLTGVEYVGGDESFAEGIYEIAVSDNEQLLLSVEGDNNDNGGNIIVAGRTDSDYQKFEIKSVEEDRYSMINIGSGKAVDVEGGSVVPGTNVQQWTFDRTAGQLWTLEKSDGTYTILSKLQTGLYVNGNKENSNVESSDEKTQWVLKKIQ